MHILKHARIQKEFLLGLLKKEINNDIQLTQREIKTKNICDEEAVMFASISIFLQLRLINVNITNPEI